MTYEGFAYLYDQLMKDVPYEQWVQFIKVQADKYKVEGNTFLDLACGSGELAIRLVEEGYSVTGVDLSSDMLAVAKQKAEKKGYPLFLVEQDMSELQGIGEFDIIGIFCDSLNYLQAEKDVLETFRGVYSHLKQGGLFLFDIHSLYKMNELFLDQTYAYNGEEVSYIWLCFPSEYPNSVEHELTFYQLDSNTQQYIRYDELHVQRTFPIEQYKNWLLEVGFEILSITADFTNEAPNDQSERVFFTVRKST